MPNALLCVVSVLLEVLVTGRLGRKWQVTRSYVRKVVDTTRPISVKCFTETLRRNFVALSMAVAMLKRSVRPTGRSGRPAVNFRGTTNPDAGSPPSHGTADISDRTSMQQLAVLALVRSVFSTITINNSLQSWQSFPPIRSTTVDPMPSTSWAPRSVVTIITNFVTTIMSGPMNLVKVRRMAESFDIISNKYVSSGGVLKGTPLDTTSMTTRISTFNVRTTLTATPLSSPGP